ncbi:MAG TPA: hypothetical protein VM328_00405 [Fimbriimonadaceae bacterium]|nr:hypothetical protein [Fimbriimonadaceae bacterium]
MRRLESLTSHLRASGEPWVVLTLHQIERILGAPLPASARRYPAFWSNSSKNAYSTAWRDAGYIVSRAGLPTDQIGFQRVRTAAPAPTSTIATLSADVLVGCVSTKRGEASAAEDLYISPLFERRRAYAQATRKPWFILSALHGIVEPRSVIDPYDVSFKEASTAERREWALQVIAQLQNRLGQLRGTVFELHAGEEYAHPLVELLGSAGAGVGCPLQGLRIGEQLHWYDEQARANPVVVTEPPRLRATGSANVEEGSVRIRGLAKEITDLFMSGNLDFSARPGAPRPGWGSLPEVATSEELRAKGASDEQIRLFLTFISAMDRARDADRLWFAGRDLFLANPWVYDPRSVSSRSFTDLGDVLMTHRVSQRHLPDAAAWRRIAESLVDAAVAPAVHQAIHEGEGNANDILTDLEGETAAGSRRFPFLSGPKIAAMWVRILAYPGRARISSIDSLPVAVDVQVRKVSEFLGLTDTYGRPLEAVREGIQEAWRRDVRGSGASGPEALQGTCAALDPAIWFYGKWGCTICVAAGRQIPIGSPCRSCRMVSLTRGG